MITNISLVERKRVVFLLCLIAVIMTVLAFLSEGNGYGGGDSVQHFLISKYSFKHHELFLHHWGKPFFTLISSPFSQFGFFGINIFNILCACFTCWLAYDLSVRWQMENAWLSVLILLCAPIYFACIISGLTEVFFATVLMFSLWLFQRERFLLSAIVISFLPFVRTEGILILPLFAVLLVVKRKWQSIAFLAAGTAIYSIVGGFYYNDFLWILHQNPYKGAESIYGHGALAFFISKNEYILGVPLVVLFLMGITALVLKKQKASSTELVLGLGSFIVYFVAHSIFWWKGLFGSDGLIRVMAAITPMVTFTSLRGFNFLMALLVKSMKVRKVIVIMLVLLIIFVPFKQHRFPRRFDYEEISLNKSGDWLRNNHLSNQRVYNATPFMWMALNRDPYERDRAADFYAIDRIQPEQNIPAGSIIVWDSHFSPNEGGIPLEKLTHNQFFRELNHFETDPDKVPKSIGRYEVHIFERI